jgi:heme-degrading monooxygenase HmoA
MRHLGLGRRALAAAEGVEFWRLLGTGAGSSTGPGADLARTALFAVWRDEQAVDAFIDGNPWPNATESWHVRLAGLGGHGTWRGVPVLDRIAAGGADGGPIAVITRADVRLRSWRAFRAAGAGVSEALHRADGLLDVVGIGEAPVGRLGTFSVWRSAADVRAFAHGDAVHTRVVAATREGRWYGEELFARFAPYGSTGTWDGRDPLGAPADDDRTGTSMP